MIQSKAFKSFYQSESAGGILLMIAAFLAMVIANSSLEVYYQKLIDLPIAIKVGTFEIAKPLLLWINDGLMALFFLAVGLELKREIIEGELSSPKKIVLPFFGAVGGMLFPALIYIFFNHHDETAMAGWAIPTATDIAFALGILMLLGKRVPLALKLFLTSLAIFDDMGAVLIIAFFYSENISLYALGISAMMVVILYIMNKQGVIQITTYGIVGVLLWIAILKSGVHATLAGIILSFFIPLRPSQKEERSPLKQLEADLDQSITFIILPLFAFVNSGISLENVSISYMTHPIPLGIFLGLFLGKQFGIFIFCYVAVKLKIAELPPLINWKILYGTSILGGIGFTMSLFISSLSFEKTEVNLLFDERLGIMIGSILSAVVGYMVLKYSLRDYAN
ncbi:MAG TPA: Na+/H+ antiporter NhaA [Epsilonproteobacteria bacterium]|nr:Na+/H+ antiporter NhaA [Campylobacterota bacterium]